MGTVALALQRQMDVTDGSRAGVHRKRAGGIIRHKATVLVITQDSVDMRLHGLPRLDVIRPRAHIDAAITAERVSPGGRGGMGGCGSGP